MVLIHAYIKKDGNIITTLPFRYNDGDAKPLKCRELIVEAANEDTLDSLRGKIVKMLDEEKQDGVQKSDEQSGDLPCVVTIE